jgi:HPt (histidine-containing phosphotransfer) domain-containing protein
MVQGLDAAKAAQLDAGLARIRGRFIASLSDRIDGFYELLGGLKDSDRWQDVTGELRGTAHKLHGICGAVGFPDIGSTAARLEARIDDLAETPEEADRVEIRDLLNQLLDVMEQSLDAE